MLIERSHIRQKMTLRERFNSIKSAFTGLPGQSLLTMAQRFMPAYGQPPVRSSKDWIELYHRNPRLAPVHQIASDVATASFGVYQKNDLKKNKLANTPLEILINKPNSNLTITRYALLYMTAVHCLMPSGECFWIKERNGLGKVTELWPVPAFWVNEIPSISRPYFTIFPLGNMQAGTINVLERDMVYFKKIDVSEPYLRGIGRAMGISDELETSEYQAKYQKRYFFNDGIPPMVGMMPGAGKEEIDRTEELWQQKYGGYNNAHKVAWINWDAKFQMLRDTAKEMDFVNSSRFLADATREFFSIPPELMGNITNSNRSTIESSYFLFTKNVLRKELLFLTDTINLQLVPEFGDDIYFEFDECVPEDKEFLLKQASEGLKNGGITVNEWRRKNGWEDLPGDKGEIMYTPLNMIPTSIIGDGALPTNLPPAEPAPEGGKTKALTPEHKQAIWRVFDKAAVKNERPFINALKKYFQSQQNKVNAALEKSVKAIDPDDILDWEEEADKLKVTLNPLWLASLTEGYEFAESTFGFGISFDVVNPRFVDWVKANGLDKAKGINETTKEGLRKTLAEGIEAGEGVPSLRDRISAVYGDAKGYRATLISRSETTATVNNGALQTYKAAKVEKKEYLATMDSRVREEHAAMNGEIVGIDEPFSDGNMAPSDYNCRCTVLPVLSD